MNQYIITEEQLANIEQDAPERVVITCDTVRSHPYPELHCEICHKQMRKDERDKGLDELKRDLKTRFVSSDSQWGRGRNSGLLECCNIINEYLELRQQAGEQE